jgi:signal peptidase I
MATSPDMTDSTHEASEGAPENEVLVEQEIAPPAPDAIQPTPSVIAPPVEEAPLMPAKPEGESWIETVKTVVYALLIALVIRTFLFQPFNIPSASMEGTLLIGDYLFVEKFSYGYSRYSFPFGLGPFSGRIFGSAPARGDVVVFKYPRDPSTDFIKRVIGLPGDRIQMINDRLYINDKVVPRTRVQDYIESIDGITYRVPQYRETLPNGKSYLALDRFSDGPADNTDVFTVPAGHYFMMGDNRDNSDDSRGSVGYVPAVNLVGKAELLFFSTDGSAHIWEFWKWPTAIRYSRLFTPID